MDFISPIKVVKYRNEWYEPSFLYIIMKADFNINKDEFNYFN